MKNILLSLFAISLLISSLPSCLRIDNTEAPEKVPAKDGVFIHISKGENNPHEVLMGLMLADKFSESNDVLVFFDIDGIDMVSKDAPNLEMEPFDTSDAIFERLVDRGVTILACPACMKVSGLEEADLRKGISTAEKELFLDFTEGRILSLDY